MLWRIEVRGTLCNGQKQAHNIVLFGKAGKQRELPLGSLHNALTRQGGMLGNGISCEYKKDGPDLPMLRVWIVER